MATIEIAGIESHLVPEFLDTLESAVALLDDLEQIQSVCGGLSMQSRANRTGNVMVQLENFTRRLRYAQDRLNRGSR